MNKTNFKVLAMATVMLLFGCAYLNAQVTVGTNNMPKATLDVDASLSKTTTPAGVIAPRVDRGYLTDNDNYTSDQTGAIVYVDNVSSGDAAGKTENVTAIGYYYFDGAKWQTLGGGGVTTNVEKKISTVAHTINLSDLPADRNYFISYGSTVNPSTFTLNALTMGGNIGKEVHIYNSNGLGNVTVNYYGLNNSQSDGSTLQLRTPGVGLGVAMGFMWTGEFWIALER